MKQHGYNFTLVITKSQLNPVTPQSSHGLVATSISEIDNAIRTHSELHKDPLILHSQLSRL